MQYLQKIYRKFDSVLYKNIYGIYCFNCSTKNKDNVGPENEN